MATPFPTTIHGTSCFVASGYAHCVGGDSDTLSGDTNELPYVYSAPILGGAVGSWVMSPNRLPQNITFNNVQSCVYSAGFAYCIGGQTPFGPISTVLYAPVSGGSIGPWQANASPFPVRSNDLSCSAFSGYIYCIGDGGGGTATTGDVYYTTINGTQIGAWKISPNPFPIPLLDLTCVVSTGYMYCLGGGYENSGSYFANKVFVAPVEGPTIGPWAISSDSYPGSITTVPCVVASFTVYCIGGYATHPSPPGRTAAVYLANFSGASIGPWLRSAYDYPTPNPINQIAGASCFVIGQSIYCVGSDSYRAYSASLKSLQVPAPVTTVPSSSTQASISTTQTTTSSAASSSSKTATSSSTLPQYTSTSATEVTSSESSSMASGGGVGIPEFPLQWVAVVVTTAMLLASYLALRRGYRGP